MRPIHLCLLFLGAAAPAAAQSTTFSSSADLVVLHAMVSRGNGAPVTGLPQEVFRVSEDDMPQEIRFFLESDAPVSIGLLIDSSGSMSEMRSSVIDAAAAFLGARQAHDEFFAMAFSDEVRPVLPAGTPFTSDASLVRAHLGRHIRARGRTAFYDGVVAGLDHLARGSTHRKVLVVIGDGGDNASRATFDDVLSKARASDTVIYAVILSDRANPSEGDPGTLRRLAQATGGLTIAPRHARSLAQGLQRINEDLRSGYTLAYAPRTVTKDGRLRRTRVTVRVPGGPSLTVRSRPGYIVPPDTPDGSGPP